MHFHSLAEMIVHMYKWLDFVEHYHYGGDGIIDPAREG